MTGRAIPAENLRPGLRIAIEPHRVHGIPSGITGGAEVDAIRYEDDGHCEVVVDCHPCYLGAGSDARWCTTYHRTDRVLVIGGVAA